MDIYCELGMVLGIGNQLGTYLIFNTVLYRELPVIQLPLPCPVCGRKRVFQKYKVRSGVVTRNGQREELIYVDKASFGNGDMRNEVMNQHDVRRVTRGQLLGWPDKGERERAGEGDGVDPGGRINHAKEPIYT